MTSRRRLLTWLVCAMTLVGAGRAESELTEIREGFDDGQWNRHWWSVDQRSPPGVKVDVSGKSLRFVIPAGGAERPPATMKGRFRLEGDFDIQVGYEAKALPQPKTGWINIQIFIDSAAGPAAVMRTNHSAEGPGYSLWWEPVQEGVAGAWMQEPTKSVKGALRLTRRGEALRFLYADNVDRSLSERDAADAGFVEIGSVKYGSLPVTHIELWVTVPETQSAVDVSFDDVVVEADKIVDPSVAADSPVGPRAWKWLLSAAVVIAAGFAVWRVWRSVSK